MMIAASRLVVLLIAALLTSFGIHLARTLPVYRFYLPEAPIALAHVEPSFPDSRPIGGAVPLDQRCTLYDRLPAPRRLPATSPGFRAAIGSFESIGSDAHQCRTYRDRFAAYTDEALGIDYFKTAQDRLGLPQHGRGERSEAWYRDRLWYANLLAESDQDRPRRSYIDWAETVRACTADGDGPRRGKMAFVLRSYQGFVWTEDAILNVRALISELSLRSRSRTTRQGPGPSQRPGQKVDIHILVEIKDARSAGALTSDAARRKVLRSSVPIEFWSLATLWSEAEMVQHYPDLAGDFRDGISAQSSYRGCTMALQVFARRHREYDRLVNWEMDTRFTGDYARLLESVQAFAFEQEGYDPTVDDTYTRWNVSGLQRRGQASRSAASEATSDRCERRQADLITFTPLFDPRGSGWYWEYDIQNYRGGVSTPRAASVGTNMVLSRRLLDAMDYTNRERARSLFCEAYAPTVALHSLLALSRTARRQGRLDESVERDYRTMASIWNSTATPSPTAAADDDDDDDDDGAGRQCHYLKAVSVPHPILFRYDASAERVEGWINPIRQPYSKRHESALRDTSFYYTSSVAASLYREWARGGDEGDGDGEGEGCAPHLLLHPVKGEFAD
ncbi:uncharacterized protein PFL1_06328 [Pseudozyma flocculosa PF-1]|uniref:Uncharacterized protein n=2 Tax=Pseudozyma flocculosa TaxID=84751 RepID=A0A5C3F7B1_9BASI|nr:uncharacterized protein PFL1_06328 [Pseudozyma flocculosa PF-1]EPQ26120.1 hypothetical protein PFL1_06328 [Pseudozyma flocculosa PF-1]SPO40364.1 uncharacterized protein PSFLO_05846 [Pseudozyma flocculosa]